MGLEEYLPRSQKKPEEKSKALEVAILTTNSENPEVKVLAERIRGINEGAVQISNIKDYAKIVRLGPKLIILYQPMADPLRGITICNYARHSGNSPSKVIALTCVSSPATIEEYLNAGCIKHVSLNGTGIPYDEVLGAIKELLPDKTSATPATPDVPTSPQ